MCKCAEKENPDAKCGCGGGPRWGLWLIIAATAALAAWWFFFRKGGNPAT
jgi:hypothetical protein